jgi:hypothetical protein
MEVTGLSFSFSLSLSRSLSLSLSSPCLAVHSLSLRFVHNPIEPRLFCLSARVLPSSRTFSLFLFHSSLASASSSSSSPSSLSLSVSSCASEPLRDDKSKTAGRYFAGWRLQTDKRERARRRETSSVQISLSLSLSLSYCEPLSLFLGILRGTLLCPSVGFARADMKERERLADRQRERERGRGRRF